MNFVWRGRNTTFKLPPCKSRVKPGSDIPPTYLRRSRRLQLTFSDLFEWVPGASAMDRRRTLIGAECKSNWRNFQPFYL